MNLAQPWLVAGRAYLGASAAGHLIWEAAQLPFYTVWQTGNLAEVAFDAVHCAFADILIAAATLAAAIVVLRAWTWPLRRFGDVAICTALLDIGFTIFSEWFNVEIRKSWAYSELMPVVPPIGTGLAPLLQWILIPPGAFLLAWRMKGATE